MNSTFGGNMDIIFSPLNCELDYGSLVSRGYDLLLQIYLIT